MDGGVGITIVRIVFALQVLVPIAWGILNWNKNRTESRASKSLTYRKTMINSAILYALAFNLIFFLQELFLALGKKALGLTSFLYHNNHTWEGEHPLASLMQGSGALAIFLIGLVCLVTYRLLENSKSIWRLFFLWIAFHGLVQSIPQVTIAYLDPGTDVGQALVGYLNLSEPLLISLAIISVVAVASFCIWCSSQLLGFGPEEVDLTNAKVRFTYIRYIAAGAGIIGCLLVVPFRVPPIGQAFTPFIIFAFSVPWIWSSVKVRRQVVGSSNRVNDKVYLAPIVLLVLLLVFFQVVLAPGVEF